MRSGTHSSPLAQFITAPVAFTKDGKVQISPRPEICPSDEKMKSCMTQWKAMNLQHQPSWFPTEYPPIDRDLREKTNMMVF
jgi:hypothetical protein